MYTPELLQPAARGYYDQCLRNGALSEASAPEILWIAHIYARHYFPLGAREGEQLVALTYAVRVGSFANLRALALAPTTNPFCRRMATNLVESLERVDLALAMLARYEAHKLAEPFGESASARWRQWRTRADVLGARLADLLRAAGIDLPAAFVDAAYVRAHCRPYDPVRVHFRRTPFCL